MSNIYLELLAEHGIEISDNDRRDWAKEMQTQTLQSPTAQSEKPAWDKTCIKCTEFDYDPRQEFYYCVKCYKCKRERIIIFQQAYHSATKFSNHWTQPLGSQNTITIYKKRFYKPITHFKEHLRRYMGARFTQLPEDLLEKLRGIDPEDVNMYFEVRSRLKALKLNKYYKDIFMIMYQLGGKNPQLDHGLYEQCITDFKWLMQHFMKNRSQWGRHSMPSNYVLLEILLRKNGHTPYYNLPTLKDSVLRAKVYEIYDQLKHVNQEFNQQDETVL